MRETEGRIPSCQLGPWHAVFFSQGEGRYANDEADEIYIRWTERKEANNYEQTKTTQEQTNNKTHSPEYEIEQT